MKKIFITLLLVLSSFLIFTTVHAEGNDKLLVIELPSNETSILSLEMSLKDFVISNVITMYGNVMVNQDGKEVIKSTSNNNKVYYELLNDATEEECTFDVTDEYREFATQMMGLDVFGEYNKVLFRVKNIETKPLAETLTLDLTKYTNMYDMPISQFSLLTLFMETGLVDNVRLIYYLNNAANENIITITRDEKVEIGDVFDSVTTFAEATISDNVTKDDDIIINLSTQDKNYFKNYYSLNIDAYSKLILKFSDFDYSSETDSYVLDFKNINSDNATLYFSALSRFKNDDLVEDMIITNADKKPLVTFRSSIRANNIFLPELIIPDGLTYADNVYRTIPDSLKQEFESMGLQGVNQLSIKFADPEFIEGKEKEFKSGESVTFKLNIDYNKFLSEGKLYIDNNLVDRKNYTISEGSTIITLNQDYVNSLNNNNHIIRATVNDGDVDTTFSVGSIINVPDTIKYLGIGSIILSGLIMLILLPVGIIMVVYKLQRNNS